MSGPLLLRADSAAAPHEIRHDRLRKDNTPSSQKSSVEAVPCAVSRRNQRGRPGEIHAEVKFLGNRFAIGCLHDRRLTTGARQIWSQNAKRSNRPKGMTPTLCGCSCLWAFTYTIRRYTEMKTVYRGEVYYAELSPVIGSEQGGIRPVLILQNNTAIVTAPLRSLRPSPRCRRKALCPHTSSLITISSKVCPSSCWSRSARSTRSGFPIALAKSPCRICSG